MSDEQHIANGVSGNADSYDLYLRSRNPSTEETVPQVILKSDTVVVFKYFRVFLQFLQNRT